MCVCVNGLTVINKLIGIVPCFSEFHVNYFCFIYFMAIVYAFAKVTKYVYLIIYCVRTFCNNKFYFIRIGKKHSQREWTIRCLFSQTHLVIFSKWIRMKSKGRVKFIWRGIREIYESWPDLNLIIWPGRPSRDMKHLFWHFLIWCTETYETWVWNFRKINFFLLAFLLDSKWHQGRNSTHHSFGMNNKQL